MTGRIETYQVGEGYLYLAPGKRVSGNPRVEREVLSPSVTRPEVRRGRGTLIPIGGAATNDNLQVVADHIAKDAPLTIFTTTTEIPEEQFTGYRERFAFVGVTAEQFHLGEHTIPEEGEAMFRLPEGAFIVGGDQRRGRVVLESLGFIQSLHEFYQAGKTVAGTSAGAHMLGEITSYESEVESGVGLAKGKSYESHANRRDGDVRQRDVVERKDVVSFGFPEGAGLVDYRDGRVRVFGREVNLRWQYNGHQADQMLRVDQMVELWSLKRKYSK